MTPRTRPYRIEYDDVVAAAIADTVAYAERAVAAGVARESVVIDPAHDFGKNTFHSLELTRRLGEMVDTGWPVLVSLSNKDFVGETLDLPVGVAAHRDAGRDRGLRAGGGADLPRARGRRDPADRRHGVDDRRPAAAAAGDPGAAVTSRRAGAGGARAAAGVRRGRRPGGRAAGCVSRGGAVAGRAGRSCVADEQGARVAEALLAAAGVSRLAPARLDRDRRSAGVPGGGERERLPDREGAGPPRRAGGGLRQGARRRARDLRPGRARRHRPGPRARAVGSSTRCCRGWPGS